MRKLAPVLVGLLAASLAGALAAQAQTVSPPVEQRAPGVPPAPRSGEGVRPAAPNNAASRAEKRGAGEDKAQVRPERDLPMPKPVPSIIAP
ncbi:hypothetical protein [uncultured Bosea sp.]|uniref:hypothetical protein n=1 Tax=uncultured Bosea sp. TaxID=211457 RepID=UPI00263B924C|nr:hypothetical protein [uncultured Bosea sp.]